MLRLLKSVREWGEVLAANGFGQLLGLTFGELPVILEGARAARGRKSQIDGTMFWREGRKT